jgi:hypothetical protein
MSRFEGCVTVSFCVCGCHLMLPLVAACVGPGLEMPVVKNKKGNCSILCLI